MTHEGDAAFDGDFGVLLPLYEVIAEVLHDAVDGCGESDKYQGAYEQAHCDGVFGKVAYEEEER